LRRELDVMEGGGPYTLRGGGFFAQGKTVGGTSGFSRKKEGERRITERFLREGQGKGSGRD